MLLVSTSGLSTHSTPAGVLQEFPPPKLNGSVQVEIRLVEVDCTVRRPCRFRFMSNAMFPMSWT